MDAKDVVSWLLGVLGLLVTTVIGTVMKSMHERVLRLERESHTKTDAERDRTEFREDMRAMKQEFADHRKETNQKLDQIIERLPPRKSA